jgi:DNA-binding GntR family transcriptional regulator
MGITTESIQRQIYEVIRLEILNQDYKQGELIPTKNIAKQYGISVMPVRNALQELTDMGLVVKKERVGYFVKKFDEKEIKEIQSVRSMYELYCLQNYFHRLDKKRIREIMERSRVAPFEEALHLDVELHSLLINASNNDFLIRQYARVRDFFWLFMYVDKKAEINSMDLTLREHELLVDSIFAGNKAKALINLEMHLKRATEDAVGILSR